MPEGRGFTAKFGKRRESNKSRPFLGIKGIQSLARSVPLEEAFGLNISIPQSGIIDKARFTSRRPLGN